MTHKLYVFEVCDIIILLWLLVLCNRDIVGLTQADGTEVSEEAPVSPPAALCVWASVVLDNSW